jgi:cell division protein FtsW
MTHEKITRKKPLNPPDYILLSVTLGLLFFGIIALASASTVLAWDNHGTTYYYFVRQLLFGVFPGLLIMTIVSRIDYHRWQKLSPFILIAIFALLIAVLIPGIGISVNGARRWISLGFTTIQPSEFAKLGLIIYLASLFDRKRKDIHDFKQGFLPSLLILGGVIFLVFLQPDLGTILATSSGAAFIFFMAGSRFKHLLATAAVAIAGLFIAIKAEPYRAARLITFLDPSHDPQGLGYHVNQALLAVGSGGLLGNGYNRSFQKHNFLPEPMGDSIFAVIAEEMGYVRSSLLIVAFTVFAFLGFRIAQNAPDNYGRLLAAGITGWITFQAFINIGAMLAIIPLTGIPLPFISYGSSALVTTMAGIGILLNISRQATFKS